MSVPGVNSAVVANRIYATPVFIAVPLTITGVQIFVGTTATGSAEIGIYGNASGGTGSLIRDFGTLSTASPSAQSITGFTQSLAAGWYFLAVGFSGTPSIISTAATDISQMNILGFTALGSSFQGFQGWTTSWTFVAGSLPTTLGTPTLNASSFPLIAFLIQ
jgi:hypothetical protein